MRETIEKYRPPLTRSWYYFCHFPQKQAKPAKIAPYAIHITRVCLTNIIHITKIFLIYGFLPFFRLFYHITTHLKKRVNSTPCFTIVSRIFTPIQRLTRFVNIVE